MFPKPRLLCLGTGAKSAALHATRFALERVGLDSVEILSIDPSPPAAHWDGRHGLTDGVHTLGTSPHKDVTYPGGSVFGAAVDEVRARLSWTDFLRAQGQQELARWVDRGCPPPPHALWARYLAWVHERTGARVLRDEVTAVEPGALGVRIRTRAGALLDAHGIVITGPGIPRRLAGATPGHARVFDAADFWSREGWRSGVLTGKVALLGRGETAAAIAVRLLSGRDDVDLVWVTSDGLLPTRDECFPTNHLYSVPDCWRDLSLDARRDVVRRGDRGVLSLAAQRELERSGASWDMCAGRVISGTADDQGVRIQLDRDGVRVPLSVDAAISALGFDLDGFVRQLLAPDLGLPADPEVVQLAVDEHLAVPTSAGRVHVPGLAGLAQGPGFPNLSCLSVLAERILAAWCGCR